MIDEEIVKAKKEQLEANLASLRSQLELKKQKHRELLKQRMEQELNRYEKELQDWLQEQITQKKHECESVIADKKKAYAETIKSELLKLFEKQATKDIKQVIKNAEEYQSSLDGNAPFKFGIKYRPKGKAYFISAVADEIIDEHPEFIYDEL